MAEKRQYEDNDNSGPPAKRPGGSPLAYKLLIDNHEAGYVIGTKGATIDSIQASSGASIRISHSSEFFPSTQKRTCMIQGNLTVVTNALNQIFDKVLEERNRGGRVPPSDQMYMEVVVPNSAAGMIIGHGGETVAKLQTDCNCKITVSKARNDEYSDERRILITGNTASDEVRSCLHKVLDWVQRDGSSGQYAFVTYSHLFEEGGDFHRGGYGRESGGGGRGGGGGRSRNSDYGRGGDGYDPYYSQNSGPRDRRYSGPPPDDRPFPPSSSGPPPLPPSRPQTNSSGRVQVKATLEAPIPDSLCWSLLRDGGRGIASLQHRSSATVTITHTGECFDDGALQRQSIATIKGTLPATQSALLLLEEMILRQSD